MRAYVGSFGIFRNKKVIHSKTMLPIGLVPHGIHVTLGPKEFFSKDRRQGTNVKHPFLCFTALLVQTSFPGICKHFPLIEMSSGL